MTTAQRRSNAQREEKASIEGAGDTGKGEGEDGEDVCNKLDVPLTAKMSKAVSRPYDAPKTDP